MVDKSKNWDVTHKVKAVPMKTTNYYDTRFCIIDDETGEILDDAQGYGYKTKQKAHAAWSYKTRKVDPVKKKEKEDKTVKIKRWMKEHKSFIRDIDTFGFEIAKGSWGPDDKLDSKLIEEHLKECDLEIDFTPAELLEVFLKGKL